MSGFNLYLSEILKSSQIKLSVGSYSAMWMEDSRALVERVFIKHLENLVQDQNKGTFQDLINIETFKTQKDPMENIQSFISHNKVSYIPFFDEKGREFSAPTYIPPCDIPVGHTVFANFHYELQISNEVIFWPSAIELKCPKFIVSFKIREGNLVMQRIRNKHE